MRLPALLSFFFTIPACAALINIQYPELLIPLKKTQPDNALFTQTDATVSYSNKTGDEQWTAVSFYMPNNNANICRLRFLINANPVKNPPFDLNGEAPFTIDVSRIEPKLVNGLTTWNNKPAIIESYDTYVLSTSNVSEIANTWFPCPKRSVAQFFVRPANTKDLEVYWFELNYSAEDGGPHGLILEMHT